MKRLEALEELSELSSTQWGLVTARQAKELGVGGYDLARLVEAGFLERLRQGVYAVTSAPLNQAQEVRAEWLALSPEKRAEERLADPDEAVVSHRTAAAMHGIGDLNPGGIDFTVPTRRQTRQPGVRFHRGRVPTADRTSLEGLPVTTVLRTLEDLVREGHDGGHLLDMVADALTTRSVVLGEVVERLAPYASVFGVPADDGEQLGEVFLEAAPAANPLTQAGKPFTSHWVKAALAPVWQNAALPIPGAQAFTELNTSIWRPEWGTAMTEAFRSSIPAAWMSEIVRPAWMTELTQSLTTPPEASQVMRSIVGTRMSEGSGTRERRSDPKSDPLSLKEDDAKQHDNQKEFGAQDTASKPPVDQDPVKQPGPGHRPRSS